MISVAIVATGVWRYHRAGALPLKGGPQRIVASMSIGSLIGAALGGLAVAVAPTVLLKVLLGAILIAAAIKTVRKHSTHEATFLIACGAARAIRSESDAGEAGIRRSRSYVEDHALLI